MKELGWWASSSSSRPACCLYLAGLVTLILAQGCAVDAASPSSSSSMSSSLSSSWLTSPSKFSTSAREEEVQAEEQEDEVWFTPHHRRSTQQTQRRGHHQQKHYHDQNNHKVRHHHQLRRLRRTNPDNRHQPKFSHTEYQQTVMENVPVHTSLLQVEATDDDLDRHGLIKYSLSDPEHFEIDDGGVVYNVRPLDFEHTNGEYFLQIYAEDQGSLKSSRKQAMVPALIRVLDTPEPPYFDADKYFFSVSELAAAGSYVGTVVARDADLNFDRYELLQVDHPDEFKIDPHTGIIRSKQPSFNDIWEFNFRAVAFDDTGLNSSVPVTVSIIASRPTYARLARSKDENTHKPVFNNCNDYDGISVKENQTAGEYVVMVQATDADHGVNGQVTYSLLSDFDSFKITTDNGSGKVTTTRKLDRDRNDKEFFLTVIARDGAPKEALQEACSFKVIVEDVNDNPPIFDQPLYEQNVATDHSPDTPVLRVTATDMDALQNADIVYSLDGNSDDLAYFNVSTSTGIISLSKKLDDNMAIDKKIFNLEAIATDKGLPPMRSEVSVRIHAVSSGNMPPAVVVQEPANPSLPEDTGVDTDVVLVCAESKIANNPNVYFTLLNGNTKDTNEDGTFAIRFLNDGEQLCPSGSMGVFIYLAMRNIDYESIRSYKLILQIVNDQNARQDVQIVVDIVDVNDNAPLLQPFDGAIVENAPPSYITTIKAIDKDISPEFRNLNYTFHPTADPDVMKKFELKPNGELWTTQMLDREEESRYRVPIQVTDGKKGHTRMTIYWITVQDINDVPPRFDHEKGIYAVQVPESRVPGKNTGIKLVVIDPDIVNHNEFQIVSGNHEQKFRIDSTTGEVSVNKDLDYDDPVRDRNFTLLVRLNDGANTMAETYITINVTNINDLQPVFEPNKYNYTVTENIDCDKPFGQVSAVDPDLPSDVYQNISYYLSMDELKNFTIDKTSGTLSIKGCLDRENSTTRGIMTLYPRAMDEGGYGHDAEPANVMININDINDNHPFIQSPDHSYAKFMENTPPEVVSGVTITLDDWDTIEHGCPCTLAFESNTPPDITDKFSVAEGNATSTYILKPLKMLDREAKKMYEIPFRTSDREGVSGVRYLTVEVGDENDSPMTDGSSTIKVYNYQGQFPSMVIGSVYVTDKDDYDVGDKTFEIDAKTQAGVDSYFDVDFNNGNITMHKGTPEGTYDLRVKVTDKFRNETAIGEVTITVVDLTEEAVMHSGSFRVAGYTAHEVLEQQGLATSGTSLYERLKTEIGKIHSIGPDNVDIFTLRDVGGGDVDVRYNCHSSPYYTASRLNGIMISHRTELNTNLNINITAVNINDCLYESRSPCGITSCQQSLRPNITSPLVIGSDTTTMVGVDITEDYTCDCGALEPPPSVCYDGFCFNGGECVEVNNTLTCKCPDDNYGPRCELKSARFEKGYAWYEPLKVCENASLFMSFDTKESTGLLLYSGPTVLQPWSDYPKDFIYVALSNWELQTYLDLGTGTVSMAIPIEHNSERSFDYTITWDDREVTFEVVNCLGNATGVTGAECKKSVPLAGMKVPSHLLNVGSPLQVGGVSAMNSFGDLASSYGWTMTPPFVEPFYGCVLELRHNDYLYDLNSTDYDKNTYKPCDAPSPARVIVGRESIVIIVVSLLCLILLVLLILCLAKRNRKSISYPELDGIVKETIGGTDLEGFGEKDMTQYDLKLLRVGPDGYLFNGEEERRLPDVADDTRQRRTAPLAQMPEGLSIGDFISDNIKKVDKDPSDFDDVRHYCYEGDEMSIASLSSIGSGGSSESEGPFDYKNDWGPRFEKLNQIYGRESDDEEDSEYEFPNIPKQRKRDALRQLNKPKTPTSTPSQSPTGEAVPRSTDMPTVTFADPDDKGSKDSQQPEYRETVNPLATYDTVEGEESWC